MKPIFIILIIIILQTHQFCNHPQKALFFSFNALKNRDTLHQLFSSLQTSTYQLSYQDENLKQYNLSNITYRLVYNNHYQRQQFINKSHIRVIMGTLKVLLSFKFVIKINSISVSSGIGYARADFDPSSFQKMIIVNGTFIQWQPTLINKMTFSGLFVLQATNPSIIKTDQFILQKIINGFVVQTKISSLIQSQINSQYNQKLTLFLNQQIIINNIDIIYNYANLTTIVNHQIKTIEIVEKQGLIAYFNIDIEKAPQQMNCSVKMPQTFNEAQFGGIQEIFSFNFVKFITINAINQGLCNIQLDQSWEIPQFQFYFGDLGNAVSFAQNSVAETKFEINCLAYETDKALIAAFDLNRVYVEVPQRCFIKVKGQQKVKFEMRLVILVKLIAENDTIVVVFDRLQARKLNFTSLDSEYVVDRVQNAKFYVEKVINSRLGKKTFGTNLPLISRNYASVILNQNFMIIFDGSQIKS